MPPPPPSPAAPPPPSLTDNPFFFPAFLTCFIFWSFIMRCLYLRIRELNIPIDDVEAQRNHPQQPHPPPNYNPNQATAAKTPPPAAEKKASSFRYTKNQAIATNTDSECSICLGEFKDGEKCRQLECEHAFHEECIDQWLLKMNQCPLCRATVSSVQL